MLPINPMKSAGLNEMPTLLSLMIVLASPSTPSAIGIYIAIDSKILNGTTELNISCLTK